MNATKGPPWMGILLSRFQQYFVHTYIHTDMIKQIMKLISYLELETLTKTLISQPINYILSRVPRDILSYTVTDLYNNPTCYVLFDLRCRFGTFSLCFGLVSGLPLNWFVVVNNSLSSSLTISFTTTSFSIVSCTGCSPPISYIICQPRRLSSYYSNPGLTSSPISLQRRHSFWNSNPQTQNKQVINVFNMTRPCDRA